MLLDGFSLGFSLHYDGPHCIRFSGNHQSALQAPSLVDDKLGHEMHLGRIAGPFQQVPFPNFQASPLGLVPKHEIGKFRLIHDLSFPKGDSINCYTSKEYTTVQYESLDIVIDLVRSYGLNSLIAKADIQDAFRLVPIRPQDYPLLGFTWNGMLYHDKVLPMCSAVSCQTFERFSRALQWILQTHFGVSKVTHLLDDFIFFGPCNESTCLTSLLSFEKLSHDIGIPLNHGKRCLPSTCQIVYGIGGELSAPPSTYNVVNRPLGANLSDTLKNKIRRGDYVNLQHLVTDDGDFDEQQHQRMTLEVRSIGQEETLSVFKPNHTKEITTTGQWLSAFTIYAAVLTEHSPQHAPGLFKHIADITEMARRFGGLAWKKYDESFRKEMKANGLHFGQVHWDARFRCLEQTVNNKAVGYSFRGQVNRSRGGFVRSPAISNQLFQKGQCFQFEQFGSCTKSACHFKHACSKCFGKHPTSRCGLRPSDPQRGGRTIAPRAPNTNKL